VAHQAFWTSSVLNRRNRKTRAAGLVLAGFAMLMGFAACTVDDRPIAPSEDGTMETTPGAGGSTTTAAPPAAAPMPVDTDDGSERNPDPSGMLSAGGAGNLGSGPAQPPPNTPMPEMPPVPTPTPLTINGRVIDFYRRPMPNVPVTIGGTTVATNAQGQFSIGGVQAPYDASLTINFVRSGRTAHLGYVYEGLTRIDPTLQALEGLTERSTDATLFVNAIGFDDPLRNLIVTFGGADAFSLNTHLDADAIFSARWSGPPSLSGVLRTLLVTRANDDSSDAPVTSYESFQTGTFALSESIDTELTLAANGAPVAVANVSGSVDVAAPVDRVNNFGLRFADGTRMELAEDREQTTAFSYLVPNLPGATISVVATNSEFVLPFAAAHRDNIAPGETNVALAIPNAVTVASPAQGAVVSRDTPFVWSAFGQTATTFVWRLEFLDTTDYMFIVTNRTMVTVPEFADGFSLPDNVPAFWSVETHGDYPTVDSAAGPTGYMDSLALRNDWPDGPNSADGYFTESVRRDFTIAP
jgi:hypothetical protein